MWNPTLRSLFMYFTCASSLALPQTSPPPLALTWAEKVDALRAHILSQPTSTQNAGFWNGPAYQVKFPDDDCHQIRLYNWDCSVSIPYKMPAVAAWIDSAGFREWNRTRFDDTRFYDLGYYRDPDDGFGFYDVARMTYGACNNRGPQSACGHRYCTAKNGSTFNNWPVPEGHTPWLDPNERNSVCLWLRDELPFLNLRHYG